MQDGTQTVPPSPGAQAAAEVLEAMARLDATSSVRLLLCST